jgi:hypothetical protein
MLDVKSRCIRRIVPLSLLLLCINSRRVVFAFIPLLFIMSYLISRKMSDTSIEYDSFSSSLPSDSVPSLSPRSTDSDLSDINSCNSSPDLCVKHAHHNHSEDRRDFYEQLIGAIEHANITVTDGENDESDVDGAVNNLLFRSPLSTFDPLLKPDINRFVLFPIKHTEVRMRIPCIQSIA